MCILKPFTKAVYTSGKAIPLCYFDCLSFDRFNDRPSRMHAYN